MIVNSLRSAMWLKLSMIMKPATRNPQPQPAHLRRACPEGAALAAGH
jgi:hypothetical protein